MNEIPLVAIVCNDGPVRTDVSLVLRVAGYRVQEYAGDDVAGLADLPQPHLWLVDEQSIAPSDGWRSVMAQVETGGVPLLYLRREGGQTEDAPAGRHDSLFWPRGESRLLQQVAALVGQCAGRPPGADDSQSSMARLDPQVFQQAMDASRSGIWICDARQPHLPVIHVNPAFERLTGMSAGLVLGLPGNELYRRLFGDPGFELQQLAANPQPAGSLQRLLHGARGVDWCEQSVTVLPGAPDEPGHYVVTMTDATARVEYETQLSRLATTDALTGLINRTLLMDRLQQTHCLAERNRQPFSILHIDLDGFSAVNASLGNTAADRLLQLVAQRLEACVRDGDTLARVGSDEFVLVLTPLRQGDDALMVAHKIHSELSKPYPLPDRPVPLTCSIGLAIYPEHGSSPEQLLHHARLALVQVKQAGGNGVQAFGRDASCVAGTLQGVDARLRQALAAGEFVLHYQPKADLFSGELSGFEALIRWQHPENGLVMPDSFIGQAEETGAIVPIGEWVVRQACLQVQQWQQQGVSPVRVAVNLSAKQFQQTDLVETIHRILVETGINPGLLELELTESMLMQDTASAVQTLTQLKRLGLMLSMDDFGTGYSSLAYLKQFPFDTLKIDRSFVKNITTEPDDATIAIAVIAMAHSMGMHVVAEGVESESQMRYLRSQHCDEMQGYYFSRPLPASDATSFILSQHRLPSIAGAQPGQRTLLLVDDEADILKALQRLLRRNGYRILTAQNAERALELLAMNEVQVVVSDQRMPDICGSELLSRVKELYPQTIRIMLSGYSEIETLTDAINRGAIYRYLTKPWDDEQVREEIRNAFIRHEQQMAAVNGTSEKPEAGEYGHD